MILRFNTFLDNYIGINTQKELSILRLHKIVKIQVVIRVYTYNLPKILTYIYLRNRKQKSEN